jgi:hypothetical protein
VHRLSTVASARPRGEGGHLGGRNDVVRPVTLLAVLTFFSSLDGDAARLTQVCGLGLPALVFAVLGLASWNSPWAPPSWDPQAGDRAAAGGSRADE